MKTKAQATIEFSIAFVCAIVFLILTCNLFVWLNHCLVRRQVEYGNSRQAATMTNDPGKDDFFVFPIEEAGGNAPELDVFSPGGRQ